MTIGPVQSDFLTPLILPTKYEPIPLINKFSFNQQLFKNIKLKWRSEFIQLISIPALPSHES